jgi:hypothetical protein
MNAALLWRFVEWNITYLCTPLEGNEYEEYTEFLHHRSH